MAVPFLIFLYLWNNYPESVQGNNYKIIQGDILVDISSGESRSTIMAEEILWPRGRIVVKFASDLNETVVSLINNVTEYIEAQTCILFRKHKFHDEDYLYISNGNNCSSFAGKLGGRQMLILAPGCWFFGTILHELSHAIGLYHEHTRPDRDDYIEVFWDNFIEGAKVSFTKDKYAELLGKYDYDSIMHYGPRSFAKKNKVTFKPKQPGVKVLEIHDKKSYSKGDVETIKKLYKC